MEDQALTPASFEMPTVEEPTEEQVQENTELEQQQLRLAKITVSEGYDELVKIMDTAIDELWKGKYLLNVEESDNDKVGEALKVERRTSEVIQTLKATIENARTTVLELNGDKDDGF